MKSKDFEIKVKVFPDGGELHALFEIRYLDKDNFFTLEILNSKYPLEIKKDLYSLWDEFWRSNET